LLGLVVAASCAPALPNPMVRKIELPATYEHGAPGPGAATIDWAAFFDDEDLNALVRDALDDNFDVQLALQRTVLARVAMGRFSGARLPQISAALDASVQRFGRYTIDGASNGDIEIAPGRLAPSALPDLFVGLQASWEPDLWNRLGNAEGAARARYLGTIEGKNLVVTNVVAQIAASYYALVALDRMQDILTETIARQTQAAEMTRVLKQAGQANELALRQFEAQLAASEALAAAIRGQTHELELRIDLLLGRTAGPVRRNRDALSRAHGAIASGVPSDLLRNRPDIRAAELDVAAARLDVAAARAAFYPRLRISADLGYEAFDPQFLIRTPESVAGNLVAGLVAPIVNRRGIENAFASASAVQVSAMVTYQRAVLHGFIDVASAISDLDHAGEIVEQQQRRRDALAHTVDAATELFRAGKASYVEVLFAQQKSLEAELDLVTALRDQQLARVRVYVALGGGWR
jgi:NodT family efflux transporter outer membrane factor (OMF) lipoprotein